LSATLRTASGMSSSVITLAGGLLLIVLALILPGPAFAEVLNSASRYPEGPLAADGGLYYAEMGSDRVLFWDGDQTRMLWGERGCLPTSISRYADGFVVLCHRPGVLVVLSRDGEARRVISQDTDGQRFVTPNASISDTRGGVYFSSSGQFAQRSLATGAVFYLDAAGGLREVAFGIHYANGVALSPDEMVLYVSAHLARQVLAYSVAPDGSLSNARVHLDLDDLVAQEAGRSWEVGPDGLAVDRAGNLYLAEYGAGRVLIVSPDGDLLATLPIAEPYVTSPALSPDEATIFVTAPAARDPMKFGKVYAIANPVHAGR
jgi:gluconolactonase